MASTMLLMVLTFGSTLGTRAEQFPAFVVEPEDTVAAPIGDRLSATLYCQSAFYRRDSEIQWYKDGIKLNRTSGYYDTTNTSMVLSTSLSDKDAVKLEGMYYCIINSTLGSARSRSAFVRTQRVGSVISDKTTSVLHSEEIAVTIQVGYMRLPLSDNRTTLWTVECGNHGKFTCSSVSCPLWHDVSGMGRLLVYSVLRLTYGEIKTAIPGCLTDSNVRVISHLDYGMPIEVRQLTFGTSAFIPQATILVTQNISVEFGSSATLYCISNHPNSTYEWKHDGTQVANQGRFSFLIDGVLQVRDVMQTDEGLYTCSATAVYANSVKHTRKTVANLTVYSLPSVNLSFTQSGIVNSLCHAANASTACRLHPNVSTVNIVCDCDGSAPLLVQILHNAVILFEQNMMEDQKSVTYNQSSPSSGIYQCIASNPYGNKQTSLFLYAQSVRTTPSTMASTPMPPSKQQSQAPSPSSPAASVSPSSPSTVSAPIPSSKQQSQARSPKSSAAPQTKLISLSSSSNLSPTPTIRAVSLKSSKDRATSDTVTRSFFAGSTSNLPSLSMSSSSTTSSVPPEQTPTNRNLRQSDSDSLPVAAMAGGAAGGALLLLLLLILIVFCVRRKRINSDQEKSKSPSSAVVLNPTYENTSFNDRDTASANGDTDAVDNRPTAVVLPIKRLGESKGGKPFEANQYDVLNRSSNTPLLTQTPTEGADNYDVLGTGADKTVPKDENPKAITTVPQEGTEYAYAATGVKRQIHLPPSHVTAGGDEYAVPDKQIEPQRDQKDKSSSRQSAVPAGTEYAYASPDVKRPSTIASDRLVIGPTVTSRQGEDGDTQDRVGNQENDSYAVPDQMKAKDNRIVVGNDEYAVSAKGVTLPRADQVNKPAAKRVPSTGAPIQHHTEGDSQYAVTKTKQSSASKKVTKSSTTSPERFTVNDSEYAVSGKPRNPKRDVGRGSTLPLERYVGGEDQYAVSAKSKSKSLPGYAKKAEDSDVTASAVDDDVQYEVVVED